MAGFGEACDDGGEACGEVDGVGLRVGRSGFGEEKGKENERGK